MNSPIKNCIVALLLLTLSLSAKKQATADRPARKDDIEPVRQMIYRERFAEALELIEPLPVSDAILWQKGYALLGLERFEEAKDAFEELSPSPYRDYAIARCLVGLNEYKDARAILEKADFPAPLDKRGEEIRYRIYKEEKDYAACLDQITRLRDLFPESYSRRWTEVERLRTQIDMGDDSGALSTFAHIMREQGDHHALNAARLMQDRVKSPEHILWLAETFYNRDAWGDALKYYEKYQQTEQGKADGKTHFRIARCNDKLGRYTKALGLYRELSAKKLFNDGWAAYGEIRCLRKLGRYDEALTILEKTEPDWKGTSAAPYAKWEGYEIGREQKDYLLAGKWASRLADDHPTHELGDNAFVLAGIFFHLGGDDTAARKYFDKIYDSGYFSAESFKNVGRYWSTRVDGTQPPKVKADLPDFYTYHYNSGSDHVDVADRPGPMPGMEAYHAEIDSMLRAAGFDDSPPDRENSHYMWGRFFAQIGIYRWAEWEFDLFFEDYPSIHRTAGGLDLFYELSDLGMTNSAYELGQDIVSQYRNKTDDIPEVLYTLEYPVFFTDRLWELGREYAIDPLFVLSVMRQESRFDIKATSWADARGLMQVIPSTGRTIARELSVTNFEPSMLYDPELSQRFGTYLLSKLIRSTGSPYTAVAAYNAGETPLTRWQNFPNADTDMLLFTELVDYGETRRYIRRVMENYIRYKLLYTKAFR